MPVSVCSLSDLPEELVSQFANGEGLLLTGAGVSRRQGVPDPAGAGTIRVGVPTAADLVGYFRGDLPEPYRDASTLEELATAYAYVRGDDELRRLLKREYGADDLRSTPFYDLVAELPSEVREFATTNYDPFLERALARRGPVVVVLDRHLERVVPSRPAVYKIHGDASAPETCVITTPDYDRWQRENEQLRDKLGLLFLEHTVVAVGYGAQDGNLRRIIGLTNMRVRSRAGQPRRFYVVKPEAAEVQHQFLAYEEPEHDLVLVPATGEAFLEWLLKQLAVRRRAEEVEERAALIDPPHLSAARAAAEATRPAQPVARDLADAAAAGSAALAGSPEGRAWSAHATTLLALAEAQAATRSRRESVRTLVSASRAFALGGMQERASALLRDAYVRALVEQRDARLADEIERMRSLPIAGVTRLRAPADTEISYYETLAEVLTGLPGDLPPEYASSPPSGTTNAAAPGAATQAAPPDVGSTDGSTPASRESAEPLAEHLDEQRARAQGSGAPGATLPAPGATAGTPLDAGQDASCGESVDLRSEQYRAAHIRAEHAVTVGDLAGAAAEFRRAASAATTDRGRAKALIRAALYRGLAARDERRVAREELEHVVVPGDAEDLVRAQYSGLAWLAALDGEWTSAATRFEEVGASALGAGDAVAAANAFRSAEWARRQRPSIDWTFEGPGTRAARIEQTIGRAPQAPRATVPELLDEAERDLRRRKTRSAWVAASAALRLAYDDVDPGNLHRARMALADVWTETLEEGGPHAADEFSVRSAVGFASLVHGELDDRGRRVRARVLRQTLGALADERVREHALDDVRDAPTSRGERAHATLLLHDLAGLLTSEEVRRVALPMVLASLAEGWGDSHMTNPAQAACRLFGQVVKHVAPSDAAAVRDALVAMEDATPPAHRNDLYLSLAHATDQAGEIADGGAAIAEQLLGTLANLRTLPLAGMPHYRHELGTALGALVGRTDTTTSHRLRAAVLAEAAQFGHREGLAVLAARGEPIAADVLGGYLAELAQRARSLARPADPAGFAGRPADDDRLTQRASRDASPTARHEAIDAVLALFAEDRQREELRVPWVRCAVRLARGTPERSSEIRSALLRLGAGMYEPAIADSFFSTHPLSSFREIAVVGRGLRARALHGAGALWEGAIGADREAIQLALQVAARDLNPHVRHGAALGLAEILRCEARSVGRDSETDFAPGAPEARALAPPVVASWLLVALVSLLSDPVPGVRHAAREAGRIIRGESDG